MITATRLVIKYENIYRYTNLCHHEDMGKAGDALRQALEGYGISQNRLAAAMQVPRPIVFRWFHGQVDPTAETVVTIVQSLRSLDEDAADEFIRLYLGKASLTPESEASIFPVQQLPDSRQVNVPDLARLFRSTTNSYKYLFFLSFLGILRRQSFQVSSPIAFKDLVVEMLANAWYPHTFFKLSFGTQDKISQKLDSLDLVVDEPVLRFRDTDNKKLRSIISSCDLEDVVSDLGGYVPFRLLVPFLKKELKQHNVNLSKGRELEKAMPEIANQYFESQKLLYKFNSIKLKECQSITIHPNWASYLEKHHKIVHGWVAWEWLNYMQKRNPSTPAIARKLFTPSKRESLKKQADYWQIVLKSCSLKCIYSGQIITPDKFSLDHYIPWSFVAHDQLWNLIPTLPEINSSKSNNIPSRKYFDGFVSIQHEGLKITHDYCRKTGETWIDLIDSFSSDLSIADSSDLLDYGNLREAYERTLQPLESLALTQGFSGDWSYK